MAHVEYEQEPRYELVITGDVDVIPGPDRAANLAAAGLPPDEETEEIEETEQ